MVLASIIHVVRASHAAWRLRRKRRWTDKAVRREMRALPSNVRRDLDWRSTNRSE